MKLITANAVEFDIVRCSTTYTKEEMKSDNLIRHLTIEFDTANTNIDNVADEIRNDGFDIFTVKFTNGEKRYSGYTEVTELSENIAVDYFAIRLSLCTTPESQDITKDA